MEGRRRVLGHGNGHLSVSLLVVGLAPGRLGAERTGIPFCGDRSGAMLDTLLARAGLSRDEVFVTNAVLCNPQDERGRNAPPAAAELGRCRDHLRATLELVSAPVVVALGRTAFSAVVATVPAASLRFEDCLGQPQPWAGRRLAATFHCGPRVTASPGRRAALLAQWDALLGFLAMPDIPGTLSRVIATALAALGAEGIEPVVERSARPEFGDWSTPAALRAARALHRSPAAIAEDLRERLSAQQVEHVREWTVTGNYVNARLDDTTWAPAVIAEALALDPMQPLPLPQGFTPVAGKNLIEHTNINTNKAAHVGHLRNACIGDTLARTLRRTAHSVEVNNFIDDTGVQVADVVVGIRELGMQPSAGEPYDQFCSRVYVEVSRRYEEDPALLQRRTAVLQAIEARHNEIADFAKQMSRKIVAAHLATMRRFDIAYDLLTWESDILELGFWRAAFEMLRDSGAIVYAESGRNAGCWVMPGENGEESVDEAETKVLVKSDGVATYTAKDIAYQHWKFGLLGRDFHYTRWDPDDPGSPATTAANADEANLDDAGYGHASRVINVIDSRQAYLQRVVREALARTGHEAEARNSIHLAYEVVALTAAAAADLGVDVDDGRSRVALSGRRGIEVRADDLLDLAIAKVGDKAQSEAAARSLAAGAVRYYLQKFSLNQIIAFDFDEALRTSGDTGVYLQYAHARAAGILRKVADDGEPLTVPPRLEPSERALLHIIDGYPRALAETAVALSPSVLTTYAFSLASALSDVYEHTPAIIREVDPVVRRFRRAVVAATRATLEDVLVTLGIEAPSRV